MIEKISRVFVILAAFSLMAANFGRVNVRVLGEDGKPLKGVKVTAIASASQFSDDVTSDRKGRAQFLALPGGEMVFRFEKEGFQILEKNLLLRVGSSENLAVTLVDLGDAVTNVEAERLHAATALYNEAVAAYNSGEMDGALGKTEAALDKNDKLAPAHALRGRLLDRQGDPAGAADAYARAYALDDSQAVLLPDLIAALQKAGRGEEASAYRAKMTERQAADPKLAFKLALMKIDEGDDGAALELLGSVISADPKHGAAIFERGMIYLRREDMDRARQDLQACIDLAPEGERAEDARAMLAALGASPS
ncbi:MAG: tetratricopeptide repeat protein [Acidobacteriota bacterium]|nr:tetratricopeptide repeat protein [Acidobacteriota bacterium]